jgi:hypothetical protein
MQNLLSLLILPRKILDAVKTGAVPVKGDVVMKILEPA